MGSSSTPFGHRHGPLLDALRGVRWPSRARSRSPNVGQHASRRRGTSIELTEYRAYRQGDDPRRLDWKLLARTDRAYLRITDERTVLPTLIAVDASASMAFPEPGHAKWCQACAIAVGLASLAHAAGDPVGLVVGGPTPSQLPFQTRRTLLPGLIRTLDAVSPAGTTELGRLLSGFRNTGRLVVISDLLGDTTALLQVASLWRRQAVELVVAHIVAAEELDPPEAPRVTDPEDPSTVRTLDAPGRSAYQTAFAAWRAETARSWQELGARYLLIDTIEPPAHAVRRIVAT